jgi:isoquinoline 1-oxidoreductase beta subunit
MDNPSILQRLIENLSSADSTPPIVAVDRRSSIRVIGLGAAGFAIAGFSSKDLYAAQSGDGELNAFVSVASDNTVTVTIKHLDKGQGVTTGLTTIVAEELDADWAQVRWEFAPADRNIYNNLGWGAVQGTGGSSSIRNSWEQLRGAGATDRGRRKELASTARGDRSFQRRS